MGRRESEIPREAESADEARARKIKKNLEKSRCPLLIGRRGKKGIPSP